MLYGKVSHSIKSFWLRHQIWKEISLKIPINSAVTDTTSNNYVLTKLTILGLSVVVVCCCCVFWYSATFVNLDQSRFQTQTCDFIQMALKRWGTEWLSIEVNV